jgi:hypothetical protein
VDEHPSLNIAVAHLSPTELDSFVVWVVKAPYPGGAAIENCRWPIELSQLWLGWQELFSSGTRPYCLPCHQQLDLPVLDLTVVNQATSQPQSYSATLMQSLGLRLWQWLFSSQVGNALAHSQGMAIGQGKTLRVRLEIRDPDSISLPWEIIQPQFGKPAISLNPQILFSRTNSDVDPLLPQRLDRSIKILLVLGQNLPDRPQIDLQQESATIAIRFPVGSIPPIDSIQPLVRSIR